MKIFQSGSENQSKVNKEWRNVMKQLLALLFLLATVFLIVEGCEDGHNPIVSNSTDRDLNGDATIEDLETLPLECGSVGDALDLITVNAGSESLTFWPYTGSDFSGQPQDPVNLIFFGEADPREIMQALLSLDNNRSGFPPVPPFTSVWTDAIGDVQTAYADQFGWHGGTVQLACGDYEQARFHIRLFRFGEWTVANAHFEVLIPGTTDHQVLSWELAEQFVVSEFLRTGLLDPVMPLISTDQINLSPFRTIPAMIYNGLPVELRVLIGGPVGDVTEDVPINTDGHAVILNLVDKIPCQPDYRVQDFVINFDQVIPKPFCSSGPMDYVYVNGPVNMRQTVRVTSNGEYRLTFKATAALTATPIDPITGEPVGETLNAQVIEKHSGRITNSMSVASGLQFQRLYPANLSGAGWMFNRIRASSQGSSGHIALNWCADGDASPATCPASIISAGQVAKLTISDTP